MGEGGPHDAEARADRWTVAVRRRIALGDAWHRLVGSIPAVLQVSVTAIAAYAFAHYVLGHAVPLLAVTVTISSLGFVRDARPIRVLETAVGMSVGIALAEVLLLGFGQGTWQLAIALVLTLLVARFLSPAASFAIAAAVQSVLVMLLPVPDGGPFVRTLDGLIGGVFALIATALIPRDPRRGARRDGQRLIDEHVRTLASLVAALRLGDVEEADRALARARATQPALESWRATLDSGLAIARISPFLRGAVFDLDRQRTMLSGMDLATRNLRVIARRIDYVSRDGAARPVLADLLARVSVALGVLSQSIGDVAQQPVARQSLLEIAKHLDPVAMLPDSSVSEQALVLVVRPYLVDLLTATGVSTSDAQAALPSV
ncbi:FUSC family protein [Plantibacter flavus]|uniref:FUSC family protein n=1 Tax=Plantibacter flavus TaxID=150123 RepID=UPI003F5CF0C4